MIPWYEIVARVKRKEGRGKEEWDETRKKEVHKGINDDWRCRRKEMEVGVDWQSQMQIVAFMLITMICFFMTVHTRPEWASGQPSACSALITVRRSFIWRTFIYSFNFLSFMCSARTPHHCDMGERRLECTANFLIGKCPQSFHYISCLNGKLYPQKERFLSLRLQSFFPSVVRSGRPLAMPLLWTAHMPDVIQVMLLLPVSRSEAGGKRVCFDRTCKSIPFSGKQRLIPQWPDGCWVVGSRPRIWVGWYQTDSWHISLLVQRGMK